ncbi:hypothetical protein [Paenibacillus sp. 1P03SA]|uniref:hypothetical protein n=1 Tax=Paenibacillus sp. 1P03SA TaxID=3132294 RepID=UPI0039A034CA
MSKVLKETPETNTKSSDDSNPPTGKPAEAKTNGAAVPVSSLNQAKTKPIASVRSKYAWFDISALTAPEQWGAIVQAMPHQKFTGVVANEQQVKQLPPNLDKITYVQGTPSPDKLTALNETYDILVLEPSVIGSSWFRRNRETITCKIGTSVNVTDPESLQSRCSNDPRSVPAYR